VHAVTIRASYLCGVAFVATLAMTGCRGKASKEQCEQLVDRYAALVVDERMKTASPDVRETAHAKERDEAKNDDNFKNCTSEVEPKEFACAMAAKSSDALVKCIE
jgi:hypothetical protein